METAMQMAIMARKTRALLPLRLLVRAAQAATEDSPLTRYLRPQLFRVEAYLIWMKGESYRTVCLKLRPESAPISATIVSLLSLPQVEALTPTSPRRASDLRMRLATQIRVTLISAHVISVGGCLCSVLKGGLD
jgi:hypothetical protein